MSKGKMVFESLRIEYEGYSPRKLQGRVRFSGGAADVTLKIEEKHCQAIIDMCADALLDAAQDMSEVMRCDIIEGVSVEKKLISETKKGFFK